MVMSVHPTCPNTLGLEQIKGLALPVTCMYTVRLFSVLGPRSAGRKRSEVRCSSSSLGKRGTVGPNGKTAFENQKTRENGRFPFSL